MGGEVWRSAFEYSSMVWGCLSTQAKKLVGYVSEGGIGV